MAEKIIFSKQEADYIHANFLKISSNKIGNHLGYRGAIVKRYMHENNLIVPKELSLKFRSVSLKGRTTFTEEQTQFIKDNYLTMPVKTMADAIGKSGCGVSKRIKQLNLVIPREIIEKRKKQSQFKKGHKSHNKGKKQTEYMSKEAIEAVKKTLFKKGMIPHNTNYDGHERLTQDGYIEIRVRQGKYRLKHIVEWEKVNGKLKKGYCLRSLDEDRTNTDPNSWKLITRAENMRLNSIHYYPQELRNIIKLKKKLIKTINEKNHG